MQNRIFFLALSVFTLFSLKSNAQGCSDAGFCTLSSLKPGSEDAKSAYVKLNAGIGAADHGISIFSSFVEVGKAFSDKFSMDARLTSIAQSGKDISVFGLSDVFVNTTTKIGKNMAFTLGAKIPLTDGNSKKDGRVLPMDYQSSLGTFDIIAGIGGSISKLQYNIAIQQPLTQNKNAFDSRVLLPSDALSGYQSTSQFKRSGDALLRVSYPFGLSKDKFVITPGLLGIYHLKEDEYTTVIGTKASITGSDGITLNAVLYFDYHINSSNSLQLNVGKPLAIREARPDGLTRSFTAALEYKIGF